ncbi:hypothetical protein RS3R2_30770 [Pseudomonas lactis]|nr:hypothetical protein RS3R2_30770 [Pseudomonas lactis]
MLANAVNDNALILDERGAWAFFASKLAPTGVAGALVGSVIAQCPGQHRYARRARR